ncbi:MAG TPA: Mur ligase family protein [Verrucomicrobiae bacterium]|nr:Mur ligase family protein [Verrucomicrobiae bacterium]
MRKTISSFSPRYPKTVIYMLQSTEYQIEPYLKWYWRTPSFGVVMKRRDLQKTKAAKMLLLALVAGMGLQILLGLFCIGLWARGAHYSVGISGVCLVWLSPLVWAHLIVVPLWLGRVFITRPKEKKLIAESRDIFAKHSATTIAVAGSYGKTTMKELLGTVLAEGRKVAITPANKNVASSHALFAKKLAGGEDVLVIEYGEGAPGDVARFSQTTRPTIGVITGIAPAHLDQYPTLEAAARDIFSLADYLDNRQVYVNAESEAAQPYIADSHITYDAHHVGSWKISGVKVGFDGVRFTMAKGSKKLSLHSGLLGRHQVGPLAAVSAIADGLGLSKKDIEEGVAKTVPFEHRMQPRPLGGAWIIDDTYNGNIDGIKAGLALLKDLPAKRKVYVTPGLVDQGIETVRVHHHMGQLIAGANPDRVVLMENSARPAIEAGLKDAGFSNELHIEDNPLRFYTGMEHLVAAGDLWVLQNDWTDNYA